MDEPTVPLRSALRAIDGMGNSGNRGIERMAVVAHKMWRQGVALGFVCGLCLGGAIGAGVIAYLLLHRAP